jgi:hypothetical protein
VPETEQTESSQTQVIRARDLFFLRRAAHIPFDFAAASSIGVVVNRGSDEACAAPTG